MQRLPRIKTPPCCLALIMLTESERPGGKQPRSSPALSLRLCFDYSDLPSVAIDNSSCSAELAAALVCAGNLSGVGRGGCITTHVSLASSQGQLLRSDTAALIAVN